MEERKHRIGRRWLAIACLMCSLGHAQGKMKPLVTWLTPCISNSTLCLNDLVVGVNFAYGALTQTVVRQNASMLSAVCQAGCLPILQDAFVSSVNAWSQAPGASQSCGAPSDPTILPTLAQATSNFVCWNSDDGAGLCITRVSRALTRAGVYDAIKVLSPTFKFTGSMLTTTCEALRPQSCCLRTWALLMAAYAQQLCMPALANEFISLPGRCSTDTPVAPNCLSTWDGFLQPLLRPRTDCVAWNSSGDGGSAIWTGSGCSQNQLQARSCPTNACDLWCGMVGFYTTAINTQATSTDSNDDDGISTGVIVFIAVFSGIVLLVVLIASILLCQMARQERNRQLRTRRPYNSAEYGGTTSSIKSARESLPSLGPRVSMVSAATTSGVPRHLSQLQHSSSDETRRERGSTNSQRDRLVEFAMLPPTASMAGRSSVGSMTGHLSLGGFQMDSMTGGASAGRTSGVGRSSLAGRSSLTVRSLKEEMDVVGPLPMTYNVGSSSRISEPVQYNVLYGNTLPGSDHSGSTSAATTPPAASSSMPTVPTALAVMSINQSPPTTPPQRKSQSFSFGVDTSPIQNVHAAVAGGEWRTAVGAAAATGSARQGMAEFPLPRSRGRSASGHSASSADALLPPRGAFTVNTGMRAAAHAAAVGVPTGRWERGSNGSASSNGQGGRTPAGPTATTPVAGVSGLGGVASDSHGGDEFHDALSQKGSGVSDRDSSGGWYSAPGNSVGTRASSVTGGGGQGESGTPGWATPTGPGSQIDSGSNASGKGVSRGP